MKKLLIQTAKIIFPLLLGGLIMLWVYQGFDFQQAGEIFLHGMNYGWMVISVLFGIISHVVRGVRWKQTLEPLGVTPKTANCINAIFISYAANLVLPRVGEISRCGILSRYDGISFSKSLGTVVTERGIDTLCVLFISGITLLLQFKVFKSFFLQTGTTLDTFTHPFTSAGFYIILASLLSGIMLLIYLIWKLSVFEKVKGVALNVWEGIKSLKRVRNVPLFIFYTFSIWFCYFMQFYLTFYCFNFSEHLGILAGLVMFIGGTFAVVVPTPNGAGPWHFAIISMMSIYGVDPINCGIFALIVHGIQTFLVILLGIYGLAALPLTNKKINS